MIPYETIIHPRLYKAFLCVHLNLIAQTLLWSRTRQENCKRVWYQCRVFWVLTTKAIKPWSPNFEKQCKIQNEIVQGFLVCRSKPNCSSGRLHVFFFLCTSVALELDASRKLQKSLVPMPSVLGSDHKSHQAIFSKFRKAV